MSESRKTQVLLTSVKRGIKATVSRVTISQYGLQRVIYVLTKYRNNAIVSELKYLIEARAIDAFKA